MYHINKKIIGNGESITLENTAKNYFKDFKIYGNSKQEGTPSIDYPSEVKSVGDNINLFDIENVTDKYHLIQNNNEFITNGDSNAITINANASSYPTCQKNLKAGDYIVSFDIVSTMDIRLSNFYLLSRTSDDTQQNVAVINSVSLKANVKTRISGSGKLNSNAIKYGFAGYFASNFSSGTIKISNIKLEEGTTATPWSPYGQGSIEMSMDNGNSSDGELELGTIKGATGNVTDNPARMRSKNFIEVDNTLKYTITSSENSNVKIFIFEYDKNKTYISRTSESWLTMPYQYNPTSNTKYIKIVISYKDNTNIDITKNIELKIYDKSQTKVLYTQKPFRAIGDVRDRFVKKDGVNKEQHLVQRYIFDGTENIQLQAVLNNVTRFSLSLQNINHSVPQLCNCLKYQSGYSLDEEHFYAYNNVLYLFINNSIATTVNGLKAKLTELYNAGTPLYVDYVTTTPELIECTPEQVEVLEYFDKGASSYDGTTNISSTDEISPIFEVIAYQKISDEFKTRLKQGKITRGYLKVLATDTEEEFIIDENNYLKDLKIQELRYVPEEGFIGGTVAKKISGNFNNVDSSFSIQDREVEAYLGVDLADGTTEYIRFGTYIVQSPEDDQVTDNTSFEALDYMIKFNLEYVDRMTYPCTMKDLLNDILDQAGVNSKIATFPNEDFIVENNQFETGTSLRDVLKAIAQIAFNWARVDEEDNLVFDFEIKDEVDETLTPDEYFNYVKSNEYGPVNVVILRNSQVEGENVTIKDDESINSSITKNICPNKWVFGQYQPSDGNIGSYQNRVRLEALLPIIPSTEYYLNTFNSTYQMIIRTYFKDKKFSRNLSTPTTFTSNSNEYYIGVTLYSATDTSSDLLELIDNGIIKPFICLNSEADKTYVSYKALGEIELVIADNPFAYTELKRKQLIEAGRRLFGLRYTPMTVDMLGLMYLNAKDRISVENLNGEKFNTYLLDHTIDYTGIVLDSMQSQAKTKTETKYQYISSLAQGLSHVEIKVDKVNKKIESIVQTQEDVSEKVAKTVARVEVLYALSDSATVAPTSGWSTTAPEWVAGKYMWQKTITTYANGTTAETAATNISGAKGEAGQNGIGITKTNITYQKSTSGTTVPTGTWQTTIPEVDENGYLWTRTEFIYSDGSKKYAYNVGKKGATGIGVKSLVDQYYLSTSNTEQTGGEWTEIQPEWQDNTYIWTRTKINWTDNSITYTDPVLANTLNDINSNIVVLRELSSSQIIENGKIITRIEKTDKRLNNDYSTTKQVDSKIDGLKDKYETLEKRFVDIEESNKEYAIKINAIDNNGVDKIKTLMGYTFNDEGLNINRDNADTGTIVDETGVQVLDKTGAGDPTDILYAGYVKENNTKYADYAGQTIVATSNLIVKNFLVIGSNSRFQDYINPILGGQGTGVYDI